jgi:hypothetical protein
MSHSLIDQEFEYECPACGRKGPFFCWSSAPPQQWIAARRHNPHWRRCEGCSQSFRVGEYRWLYIGPAAGGRR